MSIFKILVLFVWILKSQCFCFHFHYFDGIPLLKSIYKLEPINFSYVSIFYF